MTATATTRRNRRTCRSVRTQDRGSLMLAKALFTREERVYEIDSKGRKVRKFNRDRPSNNDDVRELLINVRYVPLEDALEVIGKPALDYMVKTGQLRKSNDSRDAFWVTQVAAQKYGLPAYLGARTFVA